MVSSAQNGKIATQTWLGRPPSAYTQRHTNFSRHRHRHSQTPINKLDIDIGINLGIRRHSQTQTQLYIGICPRRGILAHDMISAFLCVGRMVGVRLGHLHTLLILPITDIFKISVLNIILFLQPKPSNFPNNLSTIVTYQYYIHNYLE